MTQIMHDPDSVIPAPGASGAIAGVLGAYLVMFAGNRIRVLLPLVIIWTTVRLPAVIVIGFWIVLQLFSGYAAFGRSAEQAHAADYDDAASGLLFSQGDARRVGSRLCEKALGGAH